MSYYRERIIKAFQEENINFTEDNTYNDYLNSHLTQYALIEKNSPSKYLRTNCREVVCRFYSYLVGKHNKHVTSDSELVKTKIQKLNVKPSISFIITHSISVCPTIDHLRTSIKMVEHIENFMKIENKTKIGIDFNESYFGLVCKPNDFWLTSNVHLSLFLSFMINNFYGSKPKTYKSLKFIMLSDFFNDVKNANLFWPYGVSPNNFTFGAYLFARMLSGESFDKTIDEVLRPVLVQHPEFCSNINVEEFENLIKNSNIDEYREKKDDGIEEIVA